MPWFIYIYLVLWYNFQKNIYDLRQWTYTISVLILFDSHLVKNENKCNVCVCGIACSQMPKRFLNNSKLFVCNNIITCEDNYVLYDTALRLCHW